MSNFKFINQKDIILNLFDGGKTYSEISKIVSDNSENSKQNIRRLILHFRPNSKSNNKHVIKDKSEQIDALFKQGFKPKQIADKLCLNPVSVDSFIRKEYPNIKFNPIVENINYFDKINSAEKAYILGFICADGSLVSNKNGSVSLTITLKYEDKDVLEFMKSELNSNHKLLEIKRKSSFDENKYIHHIRLSLSHKKLVSDLMKYGITQRKSLTMGNIINNIPYDFRNSFIVGYFDGDGSVTISNKNHKRGKVYYRKTNIVSIRGTFDFLYGICEHLNISKSLVKQYDSIPSLTFTSKKDIGRFIQCYRDLKFYFKRKYNKFLFDKYRQGQTISSE